MPKRKSIPATEPLLQDIHHEDLVIAICKICERRISAKLSQKELGKIFGVSGTTISNVERGFVTWDSEILQKLIVYFRIKKCHR